MDNISASTKSIKIYIEVFESETVLNVFEDAQQKLSVSDSTKNDFSRVLKKIDSYVKERRDSYFNELKGS